MTDEVFIFYTLYFIVIAILLGTIIRAGRLQIITKYKPKKIRNEEILAQISEQEYPRESISDERFDDIIKRAYSSTTGSAIGIPICATMGIFMAVSIAWEEFVLPLKIAILLATIVAWYISIQNFKEGQRIFESDRHLFSTTKTTVIKYYQRPLLTVHNGHFTFRGHTSHLIVGMKNKAGQPVSYKVMVQPDIYIPAVKTKQCIALLYDGEFSALLPYPKQK